MPPSTTRGQRIFRDHLAAKTGLDRRVITAWMMAEEGGQGGPASGYDARGYHNYLNVGAFDSGFGSIYHDPIWHNPVRAANATADFLKGRRFGAAQGIRNILHSAGRPGGQQLQAIKNSPWASSHYAGGGLDSLYHGLRGRISPSSVGGTPPPRRTSGHRAPGTVSVGQTEPGGTGLVDLLASLSSTQQPTQQFATPPPLPAFSARLSGVGLPDIPSTAPPQAPGSTLAAQLQAVSGLGGTQTPRITATSPTGGQGAPRARPGHVGPGSGPHDALSWARGRLGVTETNGSNTGGRGHLIDAWQRNFGTHGVAWCGIFVGNALRQAGVKGIGNDWSYTGNIAAHGQGRNGGARGVVGRRNIRPGDVAVWRPGANGHTGIIESVNRDGSYVTIEGNSSNRVQRVTHTDNAVFVRPAYPHHRR